MGGLITRRQRPGTAMGVTFLIVEDETGMLNGMGSTGVMKAHRHATRTQVAMVIRGRLQRSESVTNLVADGWPASTSSFRGRVRCFKRGRRRDVR